MSVFVSWSGAQSEFYAGLLAEYIPIFVPGAEVFYSPNIEAGDRSVQAIDQALNRCKYGILCLTPSNLSAPWLNYEAGAMSNIFYDDLGDQTRPRVAPLLFGGLTTSDVEPPLANFQMRYPNRAGIRDITRGVNTSLAERANSLALLDQWFRRLWPEFEQRLAEAPPIVADESAARKRDPGDLLAEILDLVRAQRRETPTTVFGAANVTSRPPQKISMDYAGLERALLQTIVKRANAVGKAAAEGRDFDLLVDGVVFETKFFTGSHASFRRTLSRAESQLSRALKNMDASSGIIVAWDITGNKPSDTHALMAIESAFPVIVYVGNESFAGNAKAAAVVPWLVDYISDDNDDEVQPS